MTATPTGMSVVYKLTFASGKAYIGITKHKYPRARFREHACSVKSGSTKAVHCAWRKYGTPTFAILSVLPTEQICAAEQAAIREHGTLSPGGYNLTTGGEMTVHTSESRLKLSIAKRGQPIIRGRPCSEETRRLISDANTGSRRTAEQRQRMSEICKARPGRPCSPETRVKIALSKIGKPKYQPPVSEETRRKLSLAQAGKVISVEQRAKISASLKGRAVVERQGVPLTEAHRQKLKEAWVIRRARGTA